MQAKPSIRLRAPSSERGMVRRLRHMMNWFFNRFMWRLHFESDWRPFICLYRFERSHLNGAWLELQSPLKSWISSLWVNSNCKAKNLQSKQDLVVLFSMIAPPQEDDDFFPLLRTMNFDTLITFSRSFTFTLMTQRPQSRLHRETQTKPWRRINKFNL